jgi:WD40-like Beta Propeller Repeat
VSRAVRRTLSSVVVAVIACGAAAPAHATYPGRNGMLAWGYGHYESCIDEQCHDAVEIKALDFESHTRLLLACDALSPAFSSNGGMLAFYRPGQGVFTRAAAPPARATAVPGLTDAFGPAWAPSGRRLAFHMFASRTSADADIYTARRDGSGLQRLTLGGHSFGPVWSRDARLAFSWEGARPGVFVMNADGSGRHRVTRAPGPHPPSDPQAGSLDLAQSWSPDGEQIAFARRRRDGRKRVYVVRAGGRGLHRVARGAAFAAWSPEGNRIAVAPQSGRRISIVRPGGDGRHTLTIEPEQGAARCRNNHANNLTTGFAGLDWLPLPR